MRALTLLQADKGYGEQPATSGRSLISNCVPPNLENTILAQASSLNPEPSSKLSFMAAHPSSCSSLQPSSLSSTTSTLLSTASSLGSPSFTAALLSTQNNLLNMDLLLSSAAIPTSVPHGSLLSTSMDTASGALLQHFSHLQPSSLCPGPVEDQKEDDGNGGGVETFEETQSCNEEMSLHSGEDGTFAEEEANLTNEVPVLEVELGDEEHDQTVAVRQEEFPEIERGNADIEEMLKDRKYRLLNAVCCSLVNKTTAPGQKEWDSEDSVWIMITNLAKDISASDPQFLLKVAVYTRQELNIRITANFLLALAANQPSTKPHVRRYFCAAVQLPSDWLEVARIYSMCFSRSLPMCLKKAMADKFKQFSEYQLAKYNTRKHRCKHNHKKLQTERSVVDKKPSEFSMKKMIKRLHIKEPAQHVMAILGRKYPADHKAFTRSGMSGAWDRQRAGQRMKLKQPETWERVLSREGNKAATWEKLIDNNSLPFMAMLRNLRNMITQGISEAHHQKILSKLTNKKAVIQSRQFPFRFLAAYKVIMELDNLAKTSQKAIPACKDILKDVLKKTPKSMGFKCLDLETANRRRKRMMLGVPFIYRMYKLRRAQLEKANQRQFTLPLLDRYRRALEEAVQISCRYNVPPLPGRTVVFLPGYVTSSREGQQKQDFCCPPALDEEDEEEEEGEEEEEEKCKRKIKEGQDKLTPSKAEVGALLSLMVCYSAEDAMVCLYNWSDCIEAKLESDSLLDNVRSVIKQIKGFTGNQTEEETSGFFSKVFSKKNKVDNIIVMTESHSYGNLQWLIKSYRRNTNNKALLVEINLSDKYSGIAEPNKDRNYVTLGGFSEQILRFVAERGSTRLLDHVEHMDKLHSIPPPEGTKDPQSTANVIPIGVNPKLRWRGVRVFISSTFRDMHAERDVLVRSVFPELRRRAAPHCLYLQEVELRWGVTEEESGRAVELCLSEVCRSHMLVGILGERYGLVPPRTALPDLPQYSWLASAPPGLSVTEMEICQFQALYPDTTHQRMFCYFRDPNLTTSVPVAWRADFAPESKEAESKMAGLKRRILASDVKVTENYLCEWGGVVEGKPYVKGLEDFAKAVLEDLWTAVSKQFVEDFDEAEATSDVVEQEVHQGAMQRQFYGRAKLLAVAVEQVQEVQAKGGMLLVEGAPGEGKTVFMAALANALRSTDKSRKKLNCDVISYSTAASQSACSVENLLRCLNQLLRKRNDTDEKLPLPSSYKDLLEEFHSKLSDTKKDQPLSLLVDGVDLIRDVRNQLSSDWIPQQLPQGVCIVVSVMSNSVLLKSLAKKKGAILIPVGLLSMADRKEIVQKRLDVFGKKLSDSNFNNQLQTLMMKKGAVSPLYLHLACEDLRNFASFDKMKENIHGLPQTLSQLVQHSLDRLCSHYRDVTGFRWALATLTVSNTGLRERDLYGILSTCNELSSQNKHATWQEVLHLARKPKGRFPMATFTHMVRSLQSLIGQSHCHGKGDLLTLTNPEVKQAFDDFLLPSQEDGTRAHLILSAHLWAMADCQGRNTFLHSEANAIMHLPSHLIRSDQWEVLHSLLSSYYFLYANVHHGLLHHLFETYSLYDKKSKYQPSDTNPGNMEACRAFLRRHASLLSTWPALCVQQALNEPPHTSAQTWAQGLIGQGSVQVVQWLNNDSQILRQTCELVSTFPSEPTCVVMSPDRELMVVGTGQGTLHFIHTQTGQEVRSLLSSCDGVSSCVFLRNGLLATTSFDGRIEIWDIESGCRTALINGHSNVITGSDVTADGKHLATVSLDFKLKVWSSPKGQLIATLPSSSPLNCVTFDREGHLLAAGCWNGKVIVWNWLQNKVLMSLSGHKQSVHSLSFSPSTSMLCSGCISGEVRVWSVPSSTCVGRYQAHCGTTEVLTFVDDGTMLLSGGSDNMLQLWSGGLGRSVSAFKEDKEEQEPPRKKLKCVASGPAALCVAIHGDYAAVGYHGAGLKLFNMESGERTWASEDLQVSVLCLLWLVEEAGPELLVSGGGDKYLRVWKKGEEEMQGHLMMIGKFGMQQGPILALARNSSYLATASDDVTIALWSVKDLNLDPWIDPTVVSVLRGHSGGVTCLAFSPDGGCLLSGGKDQSLMVWDVASSPPALSKSLPHSHGDWITGCVWTPTCVVSSSNDGKLRVWDLNAGVRLIEIPWRCPLSSVCCLGPYVVAGCAEGGLHVWKWETSVEISHIAAHRQRIHHCSILPNKDKTKEVLSEEMIVATASDDGTVQLWKPFQVEHFNTFQGHSGGIHGVVCKEGVPEFLTVSEDCSLRCWIWATESAPSLRGAVTAVCFSQTDNLALAGYESGLLEIWQHNTVVGHKQASDSPITAVCSMPGGQFAVGCRKPSVNVWKVVWSPQHSTARLVKVATYAVTGPLTHLHHCSVLIGALEDGTLTDVTADKENKWQNTVNKWCQDVHFLGMIANDEKSMWLVGERKEGGAELGFIFAMGPKTEIHSSFGSVKLEKDSPENKEDVITAITVDREFVVCGDLKGNMWFNQPPALSAWSSRKPAHSDRISVLRLTNSTIISASYDRTVKLWDRNTKKQVGMFVCDGPVQVLEMNPHQTNELVCGDALGKLYFLSWGQ